MFVRFVIPSRDRQSGRRKGLFSALSQLESDNLLSAEEIERLTVLRGWFNRELERPERFSRSTRPHAHKAALSWFKPDAVEHITKMRELAAILTMHGYAVEMLRTARPGYVVYEDEHQIAAEPFSDTPT